MRKYRLWLAGGGGEADPASNRQIKLLKFFGQLPAGRLSKGRASAIITQLFNDNRNERRWEAYKELTGDHGYESAELLPFDAGEVERIAGGAPVTLRLIPPPPLPAPWEAEVRVAQVLATTKDRWHRWPWVLAPIALVAAALAWSFARRAEIPAPVFGAKPSTLPTAALPPTVAPVQSRGLGSTPTAPAPAPRPPAVTFAESQAAAVRKRPELAIVGSPMNRDYAATLERLKRANDPLLNDPRYPEIVADRVADEIVRRAQAAPKR